MPIAPLTVQNRAEALASRLPPLLLEAEQLARSITQGSHGLRRAGLGDDFWQYRPYMPGDAAGLIDWRRSARSQHLFVREKEFTAPQTVWLWLDTSPSMIFASQKRLTLKVRRAALLLLALAALLARAGERFTVLASGIPPVSGRNGLYQVTEIIADTERVTASLPPFYILPRHAKAVFFGDFLSPIKSIRDVIRQYAANRVSGHLVQVLDPAELALPYRGRVQFESLEDGEGMAEIKRVDDIRPLYQRRINAQRRAVATICQQLGWTYSFHTTDQAAQAALMDIYRQLSARQVL
jgi:uncharacterized protein (DUF58 family)